MARTNANPLERHVEKIVLALCAAALIASVAFYVVFTPYKTSRGYGPADVCDQAAAIAAEVATRIRSRKPEPLEKPRITTDLTRVFGDGPESGLTHVAGIRPHFGVVQQWQPTLIDIAETAEEDKHELARLLPPEKPVAAAGRSTLALPVPQTIDMPRSGESGEQRLRYWVNVAAQIDLLEQGRIFRAARYAGGKYDLPVVRVELQRRIANDPAAPWEDVETFRSYVPPTPPQPEFTSAYRLRSDVANLFHDFRRLIKTHADRLARERLPREISGDPITYPEIPFLAADPRKDEEQPQAGAGGSSETVGGFGRPGGGAPPGTGRGAPPGGGGAGSGRRGSEPKETRRFNTWLRDAEAALKLNPPDLDLATVLLEAALGEEGVDDKLRAKALERWNDLKKLRVRAGLPEPPDRFRRPEKMMPILATDLDPLPGRTYVYRMRYVILNHYLGEPTELKNPADATKVFIASDWSPPSAPVEIRTDVYFFLTAVDADANTAKIEIYKYQNRSWHRDRLVAASVGDALGEVSRKRTSRNIDFRTGAVVVDLIPERDGGTLIYLNSDDGRLYVKTVNGDRNDPKHRELSEKKLAQK